MTRALGASGKTEGGAHVAPLPLSARMADFDYPGVLSRLGPAWRLSVSLDGLRYVLQTLVPTSDGPRWITAGGRQPASLSKLVAKFGGKVAGLVQACEGLPDNPADALPDFAARLAVQADCLAATDWALDSYAGELARDGSLRIVVTPDRSAYRLQWVAKRDIGNATKWATVCTASSLSDVWQFVQQRVAGFREEERGDARLVRGVGLEARWLAMVAGLPDKPGDVHAPGLPPPRTALQASRAT